MTDMPDTNCPRCGEHLNYGCNCTSLEIEASYREAADAALAAANARITELTEALQNALAAGLPDVVADAARAALPGNSAGTGCKLSCECPDCNEM